jgi:hypothetical protein
MEEKNIDNELFNPEQDAGTGSCTELGCGTSHAAEPNAYNSTEIENVIRIYGTTD